REEGLPLIGAMRDIRLEHALDGSRRILRLDVAVERAANTRLGTEPAADMDVIAVDRIAVVGDLDARADEADVPDVVLRAGVRAAREMDVDRSIERHARLAPLRDVLRVLFGIGKRKAAADIAGAGNEAGADGGCL